MRRLLAGLAVATLGLGLAACGNDDNGGTVASDDSSSKTTTTAGSNDSSAEKENTVAVTASGFKFSPTTATAKAGEVYFEIKNDDTTTHTFTIDGTAVDIRIAGGTTGEKEADLKAGSYEWHCTIHTTMKGTLTVS